MKLDLLAIAVLCGLAQLISARPRQGRRRFLFSGSFPSLSDLSTNGGSMFGSTLGGTSNTQTPGNPAQGGPADNSAANNQATNNQAANNQAANNQAANNQAANNPGPVLGNGGSSTSASAGSTYTPPPASGADNSAANNQAANNQAADNSQSNTAQSNPVQSNTAQDNTGGANDTIPLRVVPPDGYSVGWTSQDSESAGQQSTCTDSGGSTNKGITSTSDTIYPGFYAAAISPGQQKGQNASQFCGSCYNIINAGIPNCAPGQSGCTGPSGNVNQTGPTSINIVIVNQCPGCQDNQFDVNAAPPGWDNPEVFFSSMTACPGSGPTAPAVVNPAQQVGTS